RTDDAELAAWAWRKFRLGEGDQLNRNPLQHQENWELTLVDGPRVPHPVHEAPFVSTNSAAQYGLAAIHNLVLIGKHLTAR
ncbi:hypothetical protein AB0J43_26385, partial [Nonomuraea fuscirosea]